MQAMNRIDFTASVEACRPPASAFAAITRILGAAAVRSAVTCGWMSWASAAAAVETKPACITGVWFADIPGTLGIVGSEGMVGTAGTTGAVVVGSGTAGSTGVLGAGVIGAIVLGV